MQLTSLYGGPLEFILVVESTEDPAYHAVSRLLSEFEVQVKFILKLDFPLITLFQFWNSHKLIIFYICRVL
jgi:hypothetical protein